MQLLPRLRQELSYYKVLVLCSHHSRRNSSETGAGSVVMADSVAISTTLALLDSRNSGSLGKSIWSTDPRGASIAKSSDLHGLPRQSTLNPKPSRRNRHNRYVKTPAGLL